MTMPLRRTRVIEGLDARTLSVTDLIAEDRPAILRGIARELPIVAAGRRGSAHAIDWLRQFDGGRPVTAYVGAPAIAGRFGYTDALDGLNFARERGVLGDYLDRLRDGLDDPQGPAIYIGSTDLDQYLPGLREKAVLPFGDPQFAATPPLVSAWIGNRTTAATHYDMSNNMASCLIGRRRFTLFRRDRSQTCTRGRWSRPRPGRSSAWSICARPTLRASPALPRRWPMPRLRSWSPATC